MGVPPDYEVRGDFEKRNELHYESLAIDTIRSRSSSAKEIKIPNRGTLYNFFNPHGIEIRDLLDREHVPSKTFFTTITVSSAFASLRGINYFERNPVNEIEGESKWLQTISAIALDKDNYGDSSKARENREKFKNAAVSSVREILQSDLIDPDTDLPVGVIRCGNNIAEALGFRDHGNMVSIEAKRLRFSGAPNFLGAGVFLTQDEAKEFSNKRVRLIEGVVASGSTKIGIVNAIRDWGVTPYAVDCNAAVLCPAGASFTADFMKAIHLKGKDFGAFVGGELDSNWYVRYSKNGDRLLRNHFPVEMRSLFEGQQIVGDGGDLTSNI